MQRKRDNREVIHFSIFREEPVRGFSIHTVEEFRTRYRLFRESDQTDFYTILIPDEGEIPWAVDEEKGRIKAGSILLLPPGRKVALDLKSCDGFILSFFEDFYTEEYSLTRLFSIFNLYPETGVKNVSVVIPEKNTFSDLCELSSIMRRKFGNPEFAQNPEIFRSLLNSLFIILGSIIKGNRNLSESSTIIMEKLVAMIDAHHFHEHSPLFYANALNMSFEKINRLVKGYFGMSLKKVITRKLMLEARKKLALTDKTVGEIGYSLGYEDNSYFTKAFKKYHSLSPVIYRKLHKKHH